MNTEYNFSGNTPPVEGDHISGLTYENLILGSILSTKYEFSLIEEHIKPEYFQNENNRYILIAIQQYIENKRTKDPTGNTFVEFPVLISYLNWKPELISYGIDLTPNHAFFKESLINYVHELKKIYQRKCIVSELDRNKELFHTNECFIKTVGNLETNLNKIIEEKHDVVISIGHATQRVITKEIAKLNEDKSSYVLTGFSDFDHTYGGLQPSDLIIFAARPGMGKTAFCTKVALNAAKRGVPVLFISLEMSIDQIGARILSMETGISATKGLKFGLPTKEIEKHIEAARELENLPLYICDTAGMTLNEIRKKCNQYKKTHNIGLVIIDYLQIIKTTSHHGETRANAIGEISGGLKGLAKSLDVPVIALSQLSRSLESRTDKKPILSDLRDSGTIEQDADVVMFLYRGEYYESDNISLKGKAEIKIAKHRHDVLSSLHVRFVANTTDFQNL